MTTRRTRCSGGLAALLLCTAAPLGAQSHSPAGRAAELRGRIDSVLAAHGTGDTIDVGVALIDPASGLSLMRDADRRMHAASTMKLPVLIELARRVDAGAMRWDDSVVVRNRFASIVDGSPYALDPTDDSDSTLYALEGRPVTRLRLARLMIERSSNLATNILIATLDPARVQATARRLGADSIEIRRGVEDGKAYAAGLNNTTTARDLATLLAAVARGTAASAAGTERIVESLSGQEFNDAIPAGLPPGTRVAHKTGWITGIAHDAALVYPAGGDPYVLVVLTHGFGDEATAARAIADVARVAHAAVLSARRR